MRNHHWTNDICDRCGLKRRPIPLTPNLRAFKVGTYTYQFLVEGEWVAKRPNCKLKTIQHDREI